MKVPESQLSFFDGIVDPPRLPAGPVPETLGSARERHLEAMRNPRPGFERSVVFLLRSLAEYAEAHAKRYEAPVSEDHYIGPEWRAIVVAAKRLLDGETGRLDCGEMIRQFSALESGFGDELSVKQVLEATSEPKPEPKPARGRAAKAAKVSEVPIGTKQLDERQRELLRLVRVEDNLAVYTGTERIPDWGALKSVMIALGGKWVSGKQGFVFPEDVDAAEVVRLAQTSGTIIDPKEAEFFETNTELAASLAKWVAPRTGTKILEPSAGRGAIVKALFAECPNIYVYVCEPLAEHKKVLSELGCIHLADDFMSDDATVRGFDGIAMNPPFSKRQDIRHITKAVEHLKVGGRLAAIASAGVLSRQDKLSTDFREMVKSHGGTIVVNPEHSFADAGTLVSTVTIKLEKKR